MTTEGHQNGHTNGHRTSSFHMTPRVERLTISIISMIAIANIAFTLGSEWRDLVRNDESQNRIIEKLETAINEMRLVSELNRQRLNVSRDDPWRGEDMREWGEAAQRKNPGFTAPNIDQLPGYNKRNNSEHRR